MTDSSLPLTDDPPALTDGIASRSSDASLAARRS
jgi:hypothetical protein